MELTGKKRNILIVAVIVVIVAVVVVFVIVGGQGNTPGATNGNSSSSNGAGSASSTSATRLPAPSNVVVPDMGATSTNGVAVPQVESAAAPGVDTKYRSFSIIVQNGEFIPSTVVANLGDTINIQIGAVGGNYDFTQPDLGFDVSIPDGQNKTIQFAAVTPGKFIFYCSSCGGPAKGPVGYIIVPGK